MPHPHDHRRAAVGDRDRGHGPHDPAQRDRDERPRRGSGGRREHAAARQDRHDHARQPPGRGVRAHARRDGRAPGRPVAARLVAGRDAGRAQHRGAGEGEVRPARARPLRADGARALLGGHADERHQCWEAAAAQGRKRGRGALGARAGRDRPARAHAGGRAHRAAGWHTARRGRGRRRVHPRAGRDLSEGRGQGRHARAVQPAPHHGHPHGNDHR